MSQRLLPSKAEITPHRNHRVPGTEDDDEQKTEAAAWSMLEARLCHAVPKHGQEPAREHDGCETECQRSQVCLLRHGYPGRRPRVLLHVLLR